MPHRKIKDLSLHDCAFMAFSWICCCPCTVSLLYPNLFRCGRKRPNRTRPKRTRPTPRPVRLPLRERSLTIPLDQPEAYQRTLGQAQSFFFTKLPLELRRKVYERALGGRELHLKLRWDKFFARRCKDSPCRHDRFDVKEELKKEMTTTLLRTCRRIYSEAVEVLYSSNYFSMCSQFEQHLPLPHLPRLFLSQRLEVIRHVYIYWDMTPHFWYRQKVMDMAPEWYDSWAVLGQMRKLRHLRIELSLDSFKYMNPPSAYICKMWRERQERMFAPVKFISTPRSFVIVLPDRTCSTDLDVGTTNCVFYLPEA